MVCGMWSGAAQLHNNAVRGAAAVQDEQLPAERQRGLLQPPAELQSGA